MKTKLRCISCKREVDVLLFPYGPNYIASCPKCSRLAANITKEEKKELEQKQEQEQEKEREMKVS